MPQGIPYKVGEHLRYGVRDELASDLRLLIHNLAHSCPSGLDTRWHVRIELNSLHFMMELL